MSTRSPLAAAALLVYGAICYALGVAALFYTAGFIVGLGVPTALDAPPRQPLAVALATDVALLLLFAVQHSGMARPTFKHHWTRLVPEALERSTYLLASSVALLLVFVAWQPLGGEVWRVPDGAARTAVLVAYGAGWALTFYATFLIDHFDLLGLTQVWRAARGQPYRPPAFRTPSLYRVVRHPLYVGWLTVLWAAPVMTVSHLLFALGLTLYILLAIPFEERNLADAFGERYLAYRRSTPKLIPWLRRRAPSSSPVREVP
jgi:protein-S-isoprenylcysteine O-methyltransferase Ste14